MRRSGPPRRKTGMARSGPPARRSRLAQTSAQRREMDDERAAVRRVVHERAGGACQYAAVIPEISCASPWPHRPPLEVDELSGGSARCVEWLNVDRCRLTCQAHHDWKTAHKILVLERLAAHEAAA